MRIKRFTASDMRTALRMVRDEQGPDAVILSNRAVNGGIEVVAATDYDEALVQQALRAEAPGFTPLQPRVVAAAVRPAPLPAATQAPATVPAPAARPAAASRENLVSRAARAVFRIGDGHASAHPAHATLAELTANPTVAAALPVAAAAAVPGEPAQSRFEAMMTAMAPAANSEAGPADLPASAAAPAARVAADAALGDSAPGRPTADKATPLVPLALLPIVPRQPAAPSAPAEAPHEDDATAGDATVAPGDSEPVATAPPPLRIVAGAESDPAIASMRNEMSAMRQLIERQMGQFALERLRGSPGRAAAYETLIGYGCEDALAQAVATRVDPQLDPSRVQAPMLSELARMIGIARSEPLDDGGVIALVGPTGAGKTTTAAKLAARFAARHRARDVALVTTDGERAGAREQLHAHGRRLGITVCEAAGPEALHDALKQLADYPLVLVDTAGIAARDRALFRQILWLRSARRVRSLLVLPANAHPHDLGEVIRRYRPAAPEGVVLTKLDETGRLGSALSVIVRHGLSIAYTTDGQQIPADIEPADAHRLVLTLEKLRRAADNPLATEDRHAL